MDIVSTFNPPRFLVIGESDLWVRGLTVGDFTMIIAWLDDILPGYADRELPPRFLSDESQAAMDTPLGKCVLAWSGLRHAGVTWERCQTLVIGASPGEWSRLLAILFRRRRNLKHSGEAEDLGEGWWGPMVARFCEELGYRPDDIAGLTLDQLDCLGRQGLENETPGRLTIEEVQAMWEKARSNGG